MEKLFTVLKLLPAIIAAVKAMEEAVGGSGKGEQKLIAVRQLLELVDSTITNLWPTIEGVVKILVNLFNATGVFTK